MYNTWKEFSGLSGEIKIPPNNRFHLQGKVQSLTGKIRNLMYHCLLVFYRLTSVWLKWNSLSPLFPTGLPES